MTVRCGAAMAGAAAAIAVLVVSAATAQTANNPEATYDRYVGLVNTGDKAGLAALIAGTVAERPNYQGCATTLSNRDCLIAYVSTTVIDRHGVISPTEFTAVEGDTVYGGLALRSDAIRQAGIERIVGIDKIVVRDNRIVSLKFLPNTADYQTRVFFARIAAPPGGTPPGRPPR